MKLITFTGAGTFIFLAAFFLKNNHPAQSTLYGTKWTLKSVAADSGSTVVHGKAYLMLDKAKSSAGGNGGCNAFGGTVKTNGDTINFSSLFSTKMYCEGVQSLENLYFSHLEKVNRYVIKGNTLQLYNGDSLLLRFTNMAEKRLQQ